MDPEENPAPELAPAAADNEPAGESQADDWAPPSREEYEATLEAIQQQEERLGLSAFDDLDDFEDFDDYDDFEDGGDFDAIREQISTELDELASLAQERDQLLLLHEAKMAEAARADREAAEQTEAALERIRQEGQKIGYSNVDAESILEQAQVVLEKTVAVARANGVPADEIRAFLPDASQKAIEALTRVARDQALSRSVIERTMGPKGPRP